MYNWWGENSSDILWAEKNSNCKFTIHSNPVLLCLFSTCIFTCACSCQERLPMKPFTVVNSEIEGGWWPTSAIIPFFSPKECVLFLSWKHLVFKQHYRQTLSLLWFSSRKSFMNMYRLPLERYLRSWWQCSPLERKSGGLLFVPGKDEGENGHLAVSSFIRFNLFSAKCMHYKFK